MKWKFIVPVVASILIIFIISGGIKYFRTSHGLKAGLDTKLTALFEIGSLAIIDPIWNIRKEIIKENADSLLKNEEIANIQVEDGDGNVIYSMEKKDKMYDKDYLMPPLRQDLVKDEQKIGTVTVQGTNYHIKQELFGVILSTVVEIVVMVVVLGLIVLFVTHKLSRPIINMAAVLKDIAEGEGDLTKTIPVDSNDEIGEMARYFNNFIEKLNGIVLSIKGHSRSIASGTEDLSMRMEQIGQTENALLETASSTSAAVEEMAGNISTIADNTNHLSMSADEAEKLAVDGKMAVQRTIDGINKVKRVFEEGVEEVKSLGGKTAEIGNITTVINDIADQTNLLALNAAIESARAGEQGRGFAVVADEVRKLAERTTESTKEITKMISAIQHETDGVIKMMEDVTSEVVEGVKLADNTGGVLDNIVGKMTELKQMVAMVANSTSEQSLATNEISNQAVRVTQSVQETGKAVNQGSVSTMEIASVCEMLNGIVGMFKLKGGHDIIG